MKCSQSERSGGVYCEACKKCISQPRKRKNFQPESWIICDECHPDMFRFTFVPREDSITTDFKINRKDIPALIQLLLKSLTPKAILRFDNGMD